MSRYKEIDLDKVKTNSIKNRKSKIDVKGLGKPAPSGSTFKIFLDNLPPQLAALEFRELVDAIVKAKQSSKPILVMMGGHVIKVGLAPVIIDLMKSGLINGIAMNGSGAIHDAELAYFGKTSEDVATSLKDGSFGMAGETAELLNQTAIQASQNQLGFGEGLGKRVVEENPPHLEHSIVGQAYTLSIPCTVHVAIGTDIVHQHPNADGAAIGEVTLRDFRIWTQLVSELHDGGVLLMFGSAVVLPEVFLKSLTVARNIHKQVNGFTTAVFDMIRHYRPNMNVFKRPTQDDGKGYYFTGHHEIMIPLLAAALKEMLKTQ